MQPTKAFEVADYLTVTQAMKAGFGEIATIRKHILDGTVRTKKVGRLIKVCRADLEALTTPYHPSLHLDGIDESEFLAMRAMAQAIVAQAPAANVEQLAILAPIMDHASALLTQKARLVEGGRSA